MDSMVISKIKGARLFRIFSKDKVQYKDIGIF
jgi:hypothetical protein